MFVATYHAAWYPVTNTKRGQPMTALQTIIDQAGMSQRELARRVGLSHVSINSACQGKGSGGLSMESLGAVARELAAATGRSPGEILEAIVMPIALAPPDSAT